MKTAAPVVHVATTLNNKPPFSVLRCLLLLVLFCICLLCHVAVVVVEGSYVNCGQPDACQFTSFDFVRGDDVSGACSGSRACSGTSFHFAPTSYLTSSGLDCSGMA